LEKEKGKKEKKKEGKMVGNTHPTYLPTFSCIPNQKGKRKRNLKRKRKKNLSRIYSTLYSRNHGKCVDDCKH
jgi:hypothetical protein